jgi:hypothetical protein
MKPIDAATAAHYQLLRTVPKQDIDAQLRTALHKAKTWYRLNGKKFHLPKDRN